MVTPIAPVQIRCLSSLWLIQDFLCWPFLRVSPLAAYVSSPARSLASADMREPQQPSHPKSSAALVSSLYQRLIGKALAGGSADKAFKPRESVILYVPLVQSEGKFIDVAAKMLRTSMVIDADQTALENRENAFDPVSGDIAADELARFMIDRFMLESQNAEAFIRASFIRVNCGTEFDLPNDCSLNRPLISASDRLGDDPAPALAHSQDRSFADRATPSITPLRSMLIFFKATNIRFIDFDDPAKLLEVWPARFTDAMKHEPSRRLPDANLFRQLQAGYTLAGCEKQIHRIKPLVQRNVRALENRSGAHRKVFLALVAAVKAVFPHRDPLANATYRTLWTFRPKVLFQIYPRRLLIREHLEQFEG
jgi:hypothetical protein